MPPFLGFDANASILAIADLRGCRLNPSSWNQDLALHQSSISSSTFSISPQITGGDGAIFFYTIHFFSNHLQISLRWCTIFRIQLLQAQQHHHQLDKIRKSGGWGKCLHDAWRRGLLKAYLRTSSWMLLAHACSSSSPRVRKDRGYWKRPPQHLLDRPPHRLLWTAHRSHYHV